MVVDSEHYLIRSRSKFHDLTSLARLTIVLVITIARISSSETVSPSCLNAFRSSLGPILP